MQKLPSYKVRENARAKRIIIRHDPDEGLLVVIPRGMDRRKLRKILENNSTAFDKVLKRAGNLTGATERKEELKPSAIDLPCVGETWKVRYLDRQRDFMEMRPQPGKMMLELEGPQDAERLIRKVLQDWLKRKAHRHLTGLMQEESNRTGFVYERLEFRLQKTRWGSRSASGTISLNAKLLFLEPELVRHVMIHELCHTVHMNHSPKFWSLVSQFDPQWKDHRKALRQSSSRIPLWVKDIRQSRD